VRLCRDLCMTPGTDSARAVTYYVGGFSRVVNFANLAGWGGRRNLSPTWMIPIKVKHLRNVIGKPRGLDRSRVLSALRVLAATGRGRSSALCPACLDIHRASSFDLARAAFRALADHASLILREHGQHLNETCDRLAGNRQRRKLTPASMSPDTNATFAGRALSSLGNNEDRLVDATPA